MQIPSNFSFTISSNRQASTKALIPSSIKDRLGSSAIALGMTCFLGSGAVFLLPNGQQGVLAASVNIESIDSLDINSSKQNSLETKEQKNSSLLNRFGSKTLLKALEKITTKLFPDNDVPSSDLSHTPIFKSISETNVIYPWQIATNINNPFTLDRSDLRYSNTISTESDSQLIPPTVENRDVANSYLHLPLIAPPLEIANNQLFTSLKSGETFNIAPLQNKFLAIASEEVTETSSFKEQTVPVIKHRQKNHNGDGKLSLEASEHQNDIYITRLRAEVEELIALNGNRELGIGGENSVLADKPTKRLRDRFASSNSRVRNSKIEADFRGVGEINKPKKFRETIGAAPINPENYNSVLKTPTGEVIDPQLPSLNSPEEYLPKAFDGYSWPAQGVLSSGYGWRWGKLHKGIDIAAPIGTPVFAAARGEVIFADWNSGGYGKLVKMRHPDGSVTLYAHNNKILVRKGQLVEQGDRIAEIGNTGFSTGPHLHFEIRLNGNAAVNPIAFLK